MYSPAINPVPLNTPVPELNCPLAVVSAQTPIVVFPESNVFKSNVLPAVLHNSVIKLSIPAFSCWFIVIVPLAVTWEHVPVVVTV